MLTCTDADMFENSLSVFHKIVFLITKPLPTNKLLVTQSAEYGCMGYFNLILRVHDILFIHYNFGVH